MTGAAVAAVIILGASLDGSAPAVIAVEAVIAAALVLAAVLIKK